MAEVVQTGGQGVPNGVVIVLDMNETRSLVEALRFCQVDGDMHYRLERMLRKITEVVTSNRYLGSHHYGS